ncbi:MAG: TIGR02678 family protein [Actinomycetota bacterium]|nr:TIGR02678 family protein [Actinomycetota bacterium]
MSGDPQAAQERRVAARHLLTHPLTCQEHDPDVFRLIRRHETELDRWFTQRLGYRLQLGSDTARLYKAGFVPQGRPLRTASGRALHRLEYVLLTLAIASTVAGPAVISLRDLVDLIRSSAAEAEIPLTGDGTERRALVTALRWMIGQGLMSELHAGVDAYATDEAADAVLKVRPDRIALLALPVLAQSADGADLLDRADRRDATRQSLRARLVEDPVVYRADVSEAEWTELRRRLGEEERYLDEMFGLVLEARAEGVAVVDPAGSLSDRPFPAGGTVGHAALLLVGALRPDGDGERWWGIPEVTEVMEALAAGHARYWAADLVAAPDRLTRLVLDLLVALRLAEHRSGGPGRTGDVEEVRLLPAAARFVADEAVRAEGGRGASGAGGQAALW